MKIDKGWLEKAKYNELKVKWSNNIFNSVERSIKAKVTKSIK